VNAVPAVLALAGYLSNTIDISCDLILEFVRVDSLSLILSVVLPKTAEQAHKQENQLNYNIYF
jgi:hypothetical protein